MDEIITLARQYCAEELALLDRWLAQQQEPAWVFPVGSFDYPTEQWYCACWHDMTGARNNGYGHTGVDLNVDHYPWGDVDRGQPLWAVTGGVVHAVGYSRLYLGSVVIKVQHQGEPLWIRYWHLADDEPFRRWQPGAPVAVDDCIGTIGNYTLGAGGDHCHFDMAFSPYEAHWWFTNHRGVKWCDPLPILRAHLDPEVIDAMISREG